MDSLLSNPLINTNLTRIRNSENECLHKSDFVNEKGERLADSTHLIDYLLQKDLIETENDPDIYYLTLEGYDAEETYWQDSELIEEEQQFKRRNRYVQDAYQDEERPAKVIRLSKRWQLFIVSFFVLAGSYWFNYIKNGGLDNSQFRLPKQIKMDSIVDNVHFVSPE